MSVVWPTSTPGDVGDGVAGAGRAVERHAEVAGARRTLSEGWPATGRGQRRRPRPTPRQSETESAACAASLSQKPGARGSGDSGRAYTTTADPRVRRAINTTSDRVTPQERWSPRPAATRSPSRRAPRPESLLLRLARRPLGRGRHQALAAHVGDAGAVDLVAVGDQVGEDGAAGHAVLRPASSSRWRWRRSAVLNASSQKANESASALTDSALVAFFSLSLPWLGLAIPRAAAQAPNWALAAWPISWPKVRTSLRGHEGVVGLGHLLGHLGQVALDAVVAALQAVGRAKSSAAAAAASAPEPEPPARPGRTRTARYTHTS